MSKLPRSHFYSKASYLLSRGAEREVVYDLTDEYEITKEEVDKYLERQKMSKAVSGAVIAGKDEKAIIYQMLDQKFIEEHPHFVIFSRGENYYFHEYRNGVYVPILEKDVYNMVDALMAQYQLYDYRTHKSNVKDTVQRIASLLSRTPKRHFSEEAMAHTKWYLNLTNGLLDMDTFALLPHTPDYFSTVQVPYPYDPQATHPLFDTFIEKVSDNVPSTARMIQEMFGYCIMEGNPRHKVFYLYGDTARNGKSTTAKLLCGLIGWGNVSTLSLAQIGGENSSILTSIIGKQVNFSDEISSKYIESSRLTTMSAEGIVEINPKYKNSFLHTVKTKFVITCNDLPRFQDAQGMKHRTISIPFRYHFKEQERILRYDEQLLAKEGSGILNWAIEGAKLLAKEGFTTNDLSREDMYDNMLQNNSVYAYFEMNYEYGGDKSYSIAELYGEPPTSSTHATGYRLFCMNNGIQSCSRFVFEKELKRFARETGKVYQTRPKAGPRVYSGFKREDDF